MRLLCLYAIVFAVVSAWIVYGLFPAMLISASGIQPAANETVAVRTPLWLILATPALCLVLPVPITLVLKKYLWRNQWTKRKRS